MLGFIWEAATRREFLRLQVIYGGVAVASMALSKVGLFVTRGLGRLFGLESVDSGVWMSNPMVVMAIVYGLLAALRLRSPRSFWIIAVAVLGSIAFWVIPAVVDGDGSWLEPVLAASWAGSSPWQFW